MANVNLGVGIQDNTRQGLSSAYNNVTKMTAKMAKELVMEVGVKFPDIADQIRGFESDLRKANNAIGKFQFLGERFGKQGQSLGLIDFDASSLKGNLSADKLNAIIPKLKDIRNGLATGSIKSSDFLGLGLDKELDFLDKIIERLVTVKDKYELIMRTNSKRNTELTSQAAKLNQLKQEKTIKEQIESVDRSLNRLAASDKSEREKLKEELELLKIKERYLKKQDRLSGIPEAEPSDELVRTRKRIEEIKAMQKLSNIYNTHNNLLTKLRNIAGQYFSLQGIKSFIQKVAEVTGYYERQQVALEGILRSASDAQSAMNQLKQLALNSPFQVKDLVRDTKQLAAFGVEAENLIPTVSKLADISTGLGVDMSRIILAYGQVKSATVLRGQELRQFTEAGIPMVDALAKKFTALNGELVTTADVFELISKRQVSFEMVSSVMSDMASEGGQFYKMQERITDTLAGQIEKLKDIYDQELNDIGGDVDGLLMRIVKFAQTAVKNTKSISAAMMIMIPTSYVIREIARMQMEFAKLDAEQQAKAGKWWKHAAKSGGLLAGIGGLAATAGIGIIVGLITKAYEESTKLNKEFEKIERSFAKDTNNMISGLDSLAKKITVAKKGTKEFADAVDTLALNYGDFISDDKIQALKSMGDNAHQVANEFSTLAENIKIAIREFNEYQELKAKEDEVRSQIITNVTESGNFKLQVGNSGVASRTGSKSLRYDLEEEYGHEFSIKEMLAKFDSIFDASATELLMGDDWSEETFKNIFEEKLKRVFKNINDTQLSDIINSGIKTLRLEKTALFTGKNYEVLSDIQTDIKNTDYYKLNKALGSLDLSKVVGSPLEKYKAREDAYRSVLTKTGDDSIQKIMLELIDRENTAEATNAFNELNKVLKNVASTPREVMDAFKKLNSAINDDSIRHKFNQIGEFYKKGVDLMTKKEEELYQRLNGIDKFKNEIVNLNGEKQSIQDYLETWNPAVRRNETLQQTQEKIANEYSSLKRKLEMYASEDSDLFNDEIEYIEKRMEVLKEIAKKEYYNVKLEDGNGGSNEVIPAELSNLFSDLKNAYSRYKEANQKGGIRMGLNYVRTNEQFQEMFGKFFGGANGKAFAEIQGLQVGTKTVGELLSDKFLDGIEDGVLDFESAILAIAKDLEEYAGNDPNRKAYLQASKQLVQWVESTISKDNLNASLEELENELKSLTNSFERANKVVDLYRKLQENGTINALGATIGITRQEALRTNSSRQMDYINNFVEAYNSKLPQDSQQFSIGNLSTTLDIFNAIEKIDSLTRLNGENFIATELGQSGETLKNMLKQLLDMRIQEQTTLSGEVYSGNTLQDLIANAKQRTESRLFNLTAHENIAREAGTYDMAAIKNLVNANQEEAKTIFDQFMKDNRLDIIARKNGGQIDNSILDNLEKDLRKKAEGLPDMLRDELLSKMTDLRNEVNKYNASIGAFGSFGSAIRGYRNADETALKEWHVENGRNIILQSDLENAEFSGNVEEIDRLKIELAASNERLKAMGENGKILAEELRQVSMDNLQKSIQACQSQFGAMTDSVNAVIDAAKAFSQAINKVYDVLNDGENPDWMKDMDGFLNDFGEVFEAIAAPMIAVISLVDTLTTAIITCEAAATPLLVALGVIIAVAAVVAGVVAAFQAHDRKLEREIEDLDKHIEETQNSIKNLNAAAERMVGLAKQEKQLEALSKNLEMYHDALEKLRKEEQQRNTDSDLVAKYTQESQEYLDEFLNGIHDWREEILFSVTDMASSIADAMRSAFQSGSNAAREMAAVVKQSIGDMVMNMIQLTVIEPAIQSIMEDFFGGTEESLKERFTYEENGTKKYDYKKAIKYFSDLVMNGDKMEELERDFGAVTTGLIDFMGNIDDKLSDYINFNSDTSSLSGGISGITEDTARQLEGIGNSMLMQQIIGNQHLEDINRHLFATVQVSWFNEMLQNSRSIKDATENLNSVISGMRDSNGRSLRVTMS